MYIVLYKNNDMDGVVYNIIKVCMCLIFCFKFYFYKDIFEY